METDNVRTRLEESVWRWFDAGDVTEGDALHMECDALLLERVGHGNDPPTVRCYRWRSAAVTIGRHQDFATVQAEFLGLPLYRRPTGGKAVLHGDDLTVTVCAPHAIIEQNRIEPGVLGAYTLLGAPVRAALADFTISTGMGSSRSGTKPSIIASEDCFATVAACDIIDVKHGIKIVGSAMRRTHHAVLLQMSLRPTDNIDYNDCAFLRTLRDHYTRYLNIGRWDFAAS